MQMLHIVNKSPLDRGALDSALRMAKPGSTILLIEDGVYTVTKGNKAESAIREAMKTVSISALWPDLEARGMQDAVIDGVKQVDYSGFVDLVADSSSVMSWL